MNNKVNTENMGLIIMSKNNAIIEQILSECKLNSSAAEGGERSEPTEASSVNME